MGAMGNLWIHEYFKITDGKMTEMRAAFVSKSGAEGRNFKDVFA